MKRALFAVVVMLIYMFSTPVAAASYSTDSSDLWWTSPASSESGWGIQFVQRKSTIFATMFVYGSSGAPTWYVATMTPTGGTFIWSGTLYATTGPWFGTFFNPSTVTTSAVGTMTWNFLSTNTGTLSYTVNGVSVQKNLTRQTVAVENYAGHFAGGLHSSITSCSSPVNNGTAESFGILNITQSGSFVVMQATPTSGAACTYSGSLTQSGQMGDVVGTYGCGDGESGTFHIFEFQVTEVSVNGRFTASATVPAGCQSSGWFGGIQVTTF